MKRKRISKHRVPLHEAFRGVSPIIGEAQVLRFLTELDALVEEAGDDDAHPIWALIALIGDRIREYEKGKGQRAKGKGQRAKGATMTCR